MDPARLLSIQDIKATSISLNGKKVRTWGKIEFVDVSNSLVSIVHNGSAMLVNTELVKDFNGQTGNFGQFIGALNSERILMLTSFKLVNNLNIQLFEEVLRKRMKFLEKETF